MPTNDRIQGTKGSRVPVKFLQKSEPLTLRIPEPSRVQEMAMDFTEKCINPVAARLNGGKQFPYENLKVAGLGLMGMNIPIDFGFGC